MYKCEIRWKYGRSKIRLNMILNCDVLKGLKSLPDESIDCVITSPPYWGLRDYGSETETIWDNVEGCEHEWKQNLQAAKGGYSPDSIVGNNALIKREPITTNFCIKCGAWKGQLGLEPDFKLYIKHSHQYSILSL